MAEMSLCPKVGGRTFSSRDSLFELILSPGVSITAVTRCGVGRLD
jgi:hypothetical protein